jgi:pyruvate,water dikinase
VKDFYTTSAIPLPATLVQKYNIFMKHWENLLGKLRNITKRGVEENNKSLLKKRFKSFERLLSEINTFHKLVADMEEKLSGKSLIGWDYIDYNLNNITTCVEKIIYRLNEISGNKYTNLLDRFDEINSNIEGLLKRKREIPASRYIIPFDEITREMTYNLGLKNANLGEIRNRLKIPTPDGFAISSFAFKRFMEHNNLHEKINKTLSNLQGDNLEVLNHVSQEIRGEIIDAEIPNLVEREILNAFLGLCNRQGQKVMVAIRSSALLEDGDFSFAGQYSTFLNVPSNLILMKYKEVLASLFAPRAIFYYKTKGLHENDMVMPVGVLAMIDAKAAGVIYTKDPNNPNEETLMISAVQGLGEYITEGEVTPHTYILSRHPNLHIIGKKIPQQNSMLVCRPTGELEEVPLSGEMKVKPCMSDKEINILADYAISIEEHYKSPQDIEWAIGKDNRLYILQTRPLVIHPQPSYTIYFAKEDYILKMQPPVTQAKDHAIEPAYSHIECNRILLDKGVVASKGIGFGKVYIVKRYEDLKYFPEGAILVAKHTSPKFVTVMNKANAIITDFGGATGHMSTLAREFQVPTIVDTEDATETLKNGQEITVDAINCTIYEGIVNELTGFSRKREEPFKGTQIFKNLERVLKWIVPLNLVDSEDEGFKPESCQTFHDLTRFCHETVMREMFNVFNGADTSSKKVSNTHRLVTPLPLDIHLIDLDGGIKGSQRELRPENISSVPFNAFFKGLTAMKWAQERSLDLKGFMSVISRTATTREIELNKMSEKSFCFISEKYMNFSLRLGYHFSIVEAYIGESINDNYIRFSFKGGGSSIDRRLRRVRFITEILKKMDFNVKVIKDVIDAIATKYKKSNLEEKLETLGKLTAYTNRLDVTMSNNGVTDRYIEEFIKNHLR